MQDTPGIALGGSIGGSTATTVWSVARLFSDINNPMQPIILRTK